MVPPTANAKRVILINNSSTTNAATAAGYADCLGHDYLSISVLLPTADVVSNSPSVLRILESDLTTSPTAPTNYATISGFVSGTDYTIPAAITAATSITLPFAVFNLDLRARKRFIRLEVSPRTTQIVTAEAVLTRSEQTPVPTSSSATLTVNG
jgi:hypothetical protein